MRTKWRFRAVLFAVMLAGASSQAQTRLYRGICEPDATSQGKSSGPSSGEMSPTSIRACEVSVYYHQTKIPAQLYADAVGKPLPNPFRASSSGDFSFYAMLGSHLDLTMSRGDSTMPEVVEAYIAPRAVEQMGTAYHIAAYDGSGNLGLSFSGITDTTGSNFTISGSLVAKSLNGTANSDAYITGAGNNGIANAAALGVVYGQAPATSSSSELWTTDVNTHRHHVAPVPYFQYLAHEYNVNTANDIPAESHQAFNEVFNFVFNSFRKTTWGPGSPVNVPGGSSTGVTINDNHWEPGWNENGITQGPAAWVVGAALRIYGTARTSGIYGGIHLEANHFGDGDMPSLYVNPTHTGGDPDGSGEGKVGIAEQMEESGYELTASLAATPTTGPNTALQTINLAAASCMSRSCDIASDEHPLIDVNPARNINSDKAIGMTPPMTPQGLPPVPGMITTASMHTMTKIQCVTMGANAPFGAISPAYDSRAGNPTSVTMTCTSAPTYPPTVSSLMRVACVEGTEFLYPTAVSGPVAGEYTVTGLFATSHAPGCAVFQDDGTEHTSGFLDFTKDQHIGLHLNGPGMMLRTAWEIVGAPDKFHYAYRNKFLGSQIAITPSWHNYGTSMQYNVLSRVSNVAYGCQPSGAYSDVYPFIDIPVALSGSSDASFNTTPTNPIHIGGFSNSTAYSHGLDAEGCVYWPSIGPDKAPFNTSAVLSYGGATAMDDYGAFVIHPGAYVAQVNQVDQEFANSFVVTQNDVNWTAGDAVEQAHGNPSSSTGITSLNIDNQPNFNKAGIISNIAGWGASLGAPMFKAVNPTKPEVYTHFGGQLFGPNAYEAVGVFKDIFHVDYAPVGGSVLFVGGPVGPDDPGNPAQVPFSDSNGFYNLLRVLMKDGDYLESVDGFNDVFSTQFKAGGANFKTTVKNTGFQSNQPSDFTAGLTRSGSNVCTADGTGCPILRAATAIAVGSISSGSCQQFTVSLPGLTSSMAISASAQSNPGSSAGVVTSTFYSASGVAGLNVCAIAGASTATSYNVVAQ